MRNGYQRLASAQMRLGKTTAALESAELAATAADRAIEHQKSPAALFSLARSRVLLGDILWLKGNLNSAIRDYDEAIGLLELGRGTGEPEVLQELSEAYRRASDLQGNPAFFHVGDLKRAEALCRKALEISEQLSERDKMNAQAQAQLSNVLRHLGAVLRDSDPNQSIALYQRAQGILNQLLATSPGDFRYRRDLANTSLGLSFPYRVQKRYAESLTELEKAVATHQEMRSQDPTRRTVAEDLSDTMLAMSALHMRMGRPEAALDYASRTVADARKLAERDKEDLFSERCLALAYENLGQVHAAVGNSAEARASYTDALAIWSRWRAANLAVPFSTNREREVLRLRAGSNVAATVAATPRRP